MINLEIIGSIAARLHSEFRVIFYMLLPVFFGLSLIAAWVRNPAGNPEYIDVLKRLIVASLLMAGFKEISNTILELTGGLADKISNMDGLENYVRMMSQKSGTYPQTVAGLLFWRADFVLSVLSVVSCVGLYIFKILMITLYHFCWLLLIILSPILLAFHVFSSKITINLFKSLVEVASWKIVWAVLSAMLTAIPYGNHVAAEHGHITLILLNVVIIIAMILTPLIVRALIGGAFSAVVGSMGPLAVAQMVALPTRLTTMKTRVQTLMTGSKQTRNAGGNYRNARRGNRPQMPRTAVTTAQKVTTQSTKQIKDVYRPVINPKETEHDQES